jgi:hypothetical protein
VAPAAVLVLGNNGWNWQRSLDADGFRRYDELRRLAGEAGLRPGASFRVKGSEAHAAHLTLTLHLLGYVVDYDGRTQVLSVTSD